MDADGTAWTYCGTLVQAATHVGFLVDGVYRTMEEATAIRDDATGRLRVELTEALDQYAKWQRSTGRPTGW